MGLQGMEILAYLFNEPFTEIKFNNVNTILNLSFKHQWKIIYMCFHTGP